MDFNETQLTKEEVEMKGIHQEKYELLSDSLDAISKKHIDLLILKGDSGVGKTHTTLDALREKEIDYAYINSYATPMSFYELLYHNRDKGIIVFDDLHGIHNPIILAMLKAACWVGNENSRIVSYYSTSSKLSKLNIPNSFEFNARIILIFNEDIKGYEPIINRGVAIDFNFSFEDKISIFQQLSKIPNSEISQEVLKYVQDNCNGATENLSIRSLVILSKLQKNGYNFESFAKEMFGFNEEKDNLLKLSQKEWSDKTGMHKRTYYKQKRKYGLK